MAHGLNVLLRSHALAVTHHCCQHAEVVDVVRRCISVDEPSFLVEWIGKGMRRTNRYNGPLTRLGIDVWFTRDVVTDGALGRIEALIVHFVPVHGWTWRLWWEDELRYADAIVLAREISVGFDEFIGKQAHRCEIRLR